MIDMTAMLVLKRSGLYARPRSASAVLPLVYGLMSGGNGGLWECPCLDTENFIYGLAGHALPSETEGNVPVLYGRDGAVLDPAGYVFSPGLDLEGQGVIASVTFVEDQSSREPLTVRSRGRSEAGSVLENPADVAADFLTGPAGLDESFLDGTSLSRLRRWAENAGIRLSGLVDRERPAGAVLTEMLYPWAGWWLDREGRLRLLAEGGQGSWPEDGIGAFFRAGPGDDGYLESDLDDVVNLAAADYMFNHRLGVFEGWDGGEAVCDRASRNIYGERRRVFALKWVRESSVVRAVQENIAARFGRPGGVFSLTCPDLRRIRLEKGDLAALSVDWLCDEGGKPLANELVRVLEAEFDLAGGKSFFRFMLPGQALFLTRAWTADGSRPADGGSRAGSDRDRTNY